MIVRTPWSKLGVQFDDADDPIAAIVPAARHGCRAPAWREPTAHAAVQVRGGWATVRCACAVKRSIQAAAISSNHARVALTRGRPPQQRALGRQPPSARLPSSQGRSLSAISSVGATTLESRGRTTRSRARTATTAASAVFGSAAARRPASAAACQPTRSRSSPGHTERGGDRRPCLRSARRVASTSVALSGLAALAARPRAGGRPRGCRPVRRARLRERDERRRIDRYRHRSAPRARHLQTAHGPPPIRQRPNAPRLQVNAARGRLRAGDGSGRLLGQCRLARRSGGRVDQVADLADGDRQRRQFKAVSTKRSGSECARIELARGEQNQ